MIRSTAEVLKLYANNPALKGGFGEAFGRGLIATDKLDADPKKAYYEYKFPLHHVNIQETVHGGALATMVDVATTISILRMTPLRTISISLNTEFLSVIRL
jgi:acyl-coenzyme A thioesterase 13